MQFVTGKELCEKLQAFLGIEGGPIRRIVIKADAEGDAKGYVQYYPDVPADEIADAAVIVDAEGNVQVMR